MYVAIDNNATILFSKDIVAINLQKNGFGHNRNIKLIYQNKHEILLEYDSNNVLNEEYSRIAEWIDTGK